VVSTVFNSLLVDGYEWQINAKEMKIKCRTKINENDIWD
jgi:hypothetical protein